MKILKIGVIPKIAFKCPYCETEFEEIISSCQATDIQKKSLIRDEYIVVKNMIDCTFELKCPICQMPVQTTEHFTDY